MQGRLRGFAAAGVDELTGKSFNPMGLTGGRPSSIVRA